MRLNDAIYAFHMPAFFFVSGVFLRASVQKRGERRFAAEKLRSMIYPYVLWAFLYAAAALVFARYMVTTPLTWRLFFFNLLTANTSWFLPTIFFAVMLGMLLRRLPNVALFVLAAVVSVLPMHTDILFVRLGLQHLPFLVAGMWVGMSFTRLEAVSARVAGPVAAVLCLAVVMITGSSLRYSRWMALPVGLLGTLMLLLVARCLGNRSAARGLAWIGAASFGIFLLSSFPQGAGREVVRQVLHTTAPVPQLIFPTLLAILLPAWLYHRRIRLHLNWMFVWPF